MEHGESVKDELGSQVALRDYAESNFWQWEANNLGTAVADVTANLCAYALFYISLNLVFSPCSRSKSPLFSLP